MNSGLRTNLHKILKWRQAEWR